MRFYEKAHKEDINYHLTVELANKCRDSFPKGHILICLPGYDEIFAAKKVIEERRV